MKKQAWVLVLATALSIGGIGCSEFKEGFKQGFEEAVTKGKERAASGVNRTGWHTFDSKTSGVTFEYPQGWKALQPEEVGLTFAPEQKPEVLIYDLANSSHEFGINLTFVPQKDPSGKALPAERYRQGTLELYEKSGDQFGMKNYKELDFQAFALEGLQAGTQKGQYTLTMTGMEIQSEVMFVPVGPYICQIGLTYPAAMKAEYEPIFQGIVDSVKVKP